MQSAESEITYAKVVAKKMRHILYLMQRVAEICIKLRKRLEKTKKGTIRGNKRKGGGAS